MTDKKSRGRKKDDSSTRNVPLARSPEAREKQLVNLSMELAEKQMREGTATAQVITHFLKLGSETERLSREKLRNENELLKAKVEQIKSMQKIEELYDEAIYVMKLYSGVSVSNLGEEEDDL